MPNFNLFLFLYFNKPFNFINLYFDLKNFNQYFKNYFLHADFNLYFMYLNIVININIIIILVILSLLSIKIFYFKF